MRKQSRRAFLAATATLPFTAMRARTFAQVRTRSEVRTPAGQAMLAKYAKAVGIMKARSQKNAGDTLGWTFSWYTHATPSNKNTLINKIYPGCTPADACNLAKAAWYTCQAHKAGDQEWFFLPWHRMYVAQFESIIQATLNDTTFALPYWDYTSNAAIPDAFRDPKSPLFNPRGLGLNNKPVNDGDPIDSTQYLTQLMNQALCERNYNQNGDIQGFCLDLDANLHGTVHGDIGGQMGSVPTAGNDPVFWMHHCNIDRLWASWNANGGTNPGDAPFVSQAFTFANNGGKAASLIVKGYLAIAPLGYRYDRLQGRPAQCAQARPLTENAGQAHRAPGPIALGAAPVRTALRPPQGQAGVASLRDMIVGSRLTLLIKGVRAQAPVPTVYGVYVNLPEGAKPEDALNYRVAEIHFFEVGHEDHDARSTKFLRVDITAGVRALAAKKLITGDTLSVTLIPRGEVPADARPVVEEIMVVPTT